MWSGRFLCLLGLMGLVGCAELGGVQEGSEEAARAHLAAEFDKWMVGQDSEAETMKSQIELRLDPLAYEFRSVVPDKPDFLAVAKGKDLPTDYGSWPAYRFNVYIQWKSQADTPLEKVATYTLTWNADEKKWYVRQRHL